MALTKIFRRRSSWNAAVLGVILGTIAAPHLSQGQATHHEQEEYVATDLDTGELEQEIQALDSFVEWFVQSDYTIPSSPEIVSLQVPSEQRIRRRWGSIKPQAWYQEETNTIYLPKKPSIGTIAHEITHALWDKVFSGAYTLRYRGPTRSEISDYTQSFIAQEAFTPVREMIEQTCELYTLAEIFRDIELKRKPAEIMWRALEEYSEENPFSFSREIQEIEEAIAYRRIIPQFYDEHSAAQLHEELSPQEKTLFNDMELFNPTRDGWLQLQLEVNKRHLAIIEQERNEWEEIIPKIQEVYLRLPFEYRDQFFRELQTAELDIQADEYANGFQKDTEIVCNNFLSPNEVFARMIASLYAVYLGEFTSNLYPLTKKDLKFLERFNMDGEPLFKKGIERYRVGLLMQEAGINPQQIAEQLQRATYLIYNKVEYNWPASKFKISGEIHRGE